MKTHAAFLSLFFVLIVGSAAGQTTLAEGVKTLSTQIGAVAAKAERKRVAVVPFTELDGRTTVLGGFLAEELVTHLVNGGFTVVDRATLEVAMSKQANDGVITPSVAKAVGTLVRADALITGTVTDLASQIGINCRLIDTSSGEIYGAANARVTKDDDVKKIMAMELSHIKPIRPTENKPTAAKTWERGSIRYTVESATRSERRVSLLIVLDHDKEQNVVANPGEWYLIDNNGDRWSREWDSKRIMNGDVTILPGTRIRSTFPFYCNDGSCNGTVFTIAHTDGTVLLRNLTIE